MVTATGAEGNHRRVVTASGYRASGNPRNCSCFPLIGGENARSGYAAVPTANRPSIQICSGQKQGLIPILTAISFVATGLFIPAVTKDCLAIPRKLQILILVPGNCNLFKKVLRFHLAAKNVIKDFGLSDFAA
jgi:hypothetical protein